EPSGNVAVPGRSLDRKWRLRPPAPRTDIWPEPACAAGLRLLRRLAGKVDVPPAAPQPWYMNLAGAARHPNTTTLPRHVPGDRGRAADAGRLISLMTSKKGVTRGRSGVTDFSRQMRRGEARTAGAFNRAGSLATAGAM